MKRRVGPSAFLSVAALCIGLVSGARAERLRAFSEEGYAGVATMYSGRIAALKADDVQPVIASARVVTGRWLLCAKADFDGDCAWLAHDVPSVAKLGFTDKPGSLRPERVPILRRQWGDKHPPSRKALVLFDGPNYTGEWHAVRDSVGDFTAAGQKSPESVVLNEGAWRLCTAPHYRGRCLIMTGSAWDLSEIFGRVQSAQRLR
jgi:hypothetical protein